jgi:type IV fimbrial biogenesis protein FimT
MHGRPPSLRTSGFTLVELIAVITIVSILLSIAVPSYRAVMVSGRVSTTVNGMLGDMQFVRSTALKEGRPATACISTDGTSCTGGTQWQGGWIVFSDANGNATVDGTDTVLRVQRRLSGGDSLEGPSGLTAITFNRSGFALNLPNAGVLLKLHDATNNAAHTRCLSITMAGMMTTQTHTSAPATCT